MYRAIDIPFGSKVSVPGYGLDAHIIGTRARYVCLGWKSARDHGAQKLGAWEIKKSENTLHLDIAWFEYVDDFECGWWIDEATHCHMLEEYVIRIENEEQICVECKVSAPHTKPNLPNNKFVCSFCKVIKEI